MNFERNTWAAGSTSPEALRYPPPRTFDSVLTLHAPPNSFLFLREKRGTLLYEYGCIGLESLHQEVVCEYTHRNESNIDSLNGSA